MKAKLVRTEIGARLVKVQGFPLLNGNSLALTSTGWRNGARFREADLPIPQYTTPVYEFRREYTSTSIDKLSMPKSLRSKKDPLSEAAKRLNQEIPSHPTFKVLRPVLADPKVKLSNSQYNTLIDLAGYANWQAIALPPIFTSDLKAFEKTLKHCSEYILTEALSKKKSFQAMPGISAMENPRVLVEKLKLVKELGFNFVNFVNAPNIELHWEQYSLLRKFASDADICIYGSEADRYNRATKDYNTSMYNIYSMFGQNIISPRFIPFRGVFLGAKQQNADDVSKARIRLFDKNTDGFLTYDQFEQTYGSSLADFQDIIYYQGLTLSEFFDKYDNQMLKKIGRVTETKKVNQALTAESAAIATGNLKEIMLQKKYMRPWVSRAAQKTLFY